jgi:archaeal preflagellin peptidase FlaK
MLENSLLQFFLFGSNIALSLIVLIYASWSDFKTREVSNRVWGIYAPIALLLSSSNYLIFMQAQLPYYALCIGITTGLAFLLFYLGMFGGADSKAFMCLALSLPFAPLALITPYFSGTAISPISVFVFPVTIFGNAVLFAATSGIYIVIRNLIWHKKNHLEFFPGTLASAGLSKKLIVFVTAYKMNISRVAEKWHIYPLEDIDDLNRQLVVVPQDERRDQIVDRLSNAAKAGKIDNYVWATPGLPMLIFVTLGLITALTLGDFVWLLVRFVLGA